MTIPSYLVRVTGESQSGQTFNGTGFIVSAKGHVVTCNHVVVHGGKPARKIDVYVHGYQDPWRYVLQDSSPDHDLALLEGMVPPSNETPQATLHTRWSQDARIGQPLAIFGHSSANNYPAGQRYVCSISAFSEKDGRVGINCDINEGDSGGPVLDNKDRVIGVIHAKDRVRDGQARFIPVSLLIAFLNRAGVSFEAHQKNKTTTKPKTDYTPNPFVYRKGIDDSAAFFNRKDEQLTIRDYLHTRQNCQIVGPRRIGKSSLLLQVERILHKWEKKSVIAYVDLQDARCSTLSGWLNLVSQRLQWSHPAKSLGAFNERIEEMVNRNLLPVLCLDEFEEFTMRRKEFNRDFFMNLRHCGKGMTIITASQRQLNKLTEPDDPTSPFYNTFPLLKLGPFVEEDVQAFLSLPRPGIPPFEIAEREAISAFAQGRPLALQVGCSHVLKRSRTRLSLSAALERAQEELEAYLHSDKNTSDQGED